MCVGAVCTLADVHIAQKRTSQSDLHKEGTKTELSFHQKLIVVGRWLGVGATTRVLRID